MSMLSYIYLLMLAYVCILYVYTIKLTVGKNRTQFYPPKQGSSCWIWLNLAARGQHQQDLLFLFIHQQGLFDFRHQLCLSAVFFGSYPSGNAIHNMWPLHDRKLIFVVFILISRCTVYAAPPVAAQSTWHTMHRYQGSLVRAKGVIKNNSFLEWCRGSLIILIELV